ncbi:hypothetical protein, conserved [Babesia ovata]|uniref:C3H1-type domain-containing protein n=1 Tax=Babesia ovata TaxID=189622 RepID=A0A2H6K8B4_9APIC|nr:uncharacterized protein BOVATA_007240 [Babesia ovata]GBE59231.1 hypothetical protein, conserved [Babesia ovata]
MLLRALLKGKDNLSALQNTGNVTPIVARSSLTLTKRKINLKSPKKEKDDHYNEVHYLTEDARQSALDDIDARRISLGQLAGQLSGLIGGSEEVKKAIVNGLHSNVTQLEKLLKTSCGGEGVVTIMMLKITLMMSMRSLKITLKRNKTSENLTVILSKCKLNGLDGPLKELKDAITEKIEKLNKDIESLKKADKDAKQRNETPQNASEIVKFNKDLQSHNASKRSLETLKELCGYAGKIQKNHENPKKLLESLCTGLEKFLGYQDGNYTGEGIVYSDLDRLCDGVMAFLHGVLESVKNDSNVMHYHDFSSCIETVKSNMYQRGRFNDAIKAVAVALRKWDGNLSAKTKTVTDNLDALSTNIGTNIDSISHVDTSPDTFDGSVKQWVKTVMGSLVTTLLQAEGSIRDLDEIMHKKLKNDFDHIKLQVFNLESAVYREQTEMQALSKNVRLTHDDLREILKLKVKTEIEKLRDLLVANIDKFRERLEDIKIQLDEQVAALEDCIEKMTKVIEDALWKTEEVLRRVQDNHKTNIEKKTEITKQAEDLKNKAVSLRTATNEVKKAVEQQVTQALEKVLVLDRAVRTGLKETKEWIEIAVKNYVKTQLLGDIKGKVEKITGTSGDGLEDIVSALKEWARGFGKDDKFGEKVQDWIDDILKAEPASGRLGSYVSSRSVKFRPPYTSIQSGGDDGLHTAIKKVMVAEILKQVPETFKIINAIDMDKENMEANLINVKAVCLQFAKELGEKLNNGGHLDTVASTIANKVEEELTGDKAAYPNLNRAVRSILHQLVGAARKAGAAVGSFTGDDDGSGSDITSVNAALTVAQLLEKDLKQATADSGTGAVAPIHTDTTGEHKYKFDARILGILQEQIGTDATGGGRNGQLEKAHETHFLYYGGLINQKNPKLKIQDAVLTGNAGDDEGTFPQAIKQIETTGLSQLTSGNGIEAILNEKTRTFESPFHNIQKELTALTQFVTNDGKTGVKDFLTELKTEKIAKELQKIQSGIDTILLKQLTPLIKGIQTFTAKTLPYAAQATTKTINNFVNDEVKRATDDIKKDALTRYKTSKQDELRALRIEVESLVKQIKKTVEFDLANGLKGFLRTMKDNVNDLTDDRNLKSMSISTNLVVTRLSNYIQTQIKDTPQHAQLEDIKKAFNTPFTQLSYADYPHFNHNFVMLGEKLEQKTNALSPSNFHGFHNPLLLDALKAGMTQFTAELSHAYVNKYSGCKPVKNWDDVKSSDKLSTEGRNCAKVCLTILERVSYDLAQLRSRCKDGAKEKWHEKTICLIEMSSKKNVVNPLGDWLKKHGFTVPKDKDAQNGELNKDKKGNEIYDLLVKDDEKHVYKKDNSKEDEGPIRALRRHVERYYKVSHYIIPPKPKAPTTVNQMLQWLTGLQYNPVYAPLCNYFKQLFPKPKGYERDYKEIPSDQLKLEYHQYARITHKELTDTLETLCRQSEKMLITFLGHGHADGIYAVEFSNNSLNLLYPGSPATCLDMLVDVLNRVYYQLNFIYKMCHNGRSRGGWEECHYGRYIGGSHWNCNEKQCPDQDCDQTCTQKHTPNCDQRVSCGLKSPLQSFLEDGLQGFLPHQLKKPSCKLECTVPNHQGIPCLTPMGFADISQVASHTQTGKHLFGALYYFCGTTYALTKLCSTLNCLLRTPPKSLGDMLAFYHKFLENYSRQNHKQIAFDEAARKANFGNPDTKLDIVSIQGSKSHTAKHSQGDLFGIISCNTSGSSKNPVVPCGSYMQPLTLDVVSMFSETRAANYLSWIVYITETFCVLLMKLLDECCNNCNKPGTKCHDKACAEKCEVKLAYEAEQSKNAPTSPAELTGKRHSTDCHSIVKCQLTHPTLYKYGFTFESPYDLSGEYGQQTRRTCIDLCHALEKLTSLYVYFISPLVPLFPLPAAHRRRPPRRPEDTLPLKITFKPQDRRAVAPRRCKGWENCQRQVLLTIILPPFTIYKSPPSPPSSPNLQLSSQCSNHIHDSQANT